MNSDQRLFGKNKKDNNARICAPEKMLITVYRRDYYPALVKKLKESMKDNYTDEDGEKAFQLLIKMQKENGAFQEILAEYLQEKIKAEREKFLGSSRAQL